MTGEKFWKTSLRKAGIWHFRKIDREKRCCRLALSQPRFVTVWIFCMWSSQRICVSNIIYSIPLLKQLMSMHLLFLMKICAEISLTLCMDDLMIAFANSGLPFRKPKLRFVIFIFGIFIVLENRIKIFKKYCSLTLV